MQPSLRDGERERAYGCCFFLLSMSTSTSSLLLSWFDVCLMRVVCESMISESYGNFDGFCIVKWFQFWRTIGLIWIQGVHTHTQRAICANAKNKVWVVLSMCVRGCYRLFGLFAHEHDLRCLSTRHCQAATEHLGVSYREQEKKKTNRCTAKIKHSNRMRRNLAKEKTTHRRKKTTVQWRASNQIQNRSMIKNEKQCIVQCKNFVQFNRIS